MMLRYARVREILQQDYNVSLVKNRKNGQINRVCFEILKEKDQSFFHINGGKMISVGIKQYTNYWIMSTDEQNHYIAINPDFERKNANYDRNDENQMKQAAYLSSCEGILRAVIDSKLDEDKKRKIFNVLGN
ncbi:hypothetical protein [Bacillus cereus]|uniref:hypothetical protein n=1 Tax=Bacillus cereus TaxID=1396 RepID=UPI003D65B201